MTTQKTATRISNTGIAQKTIHNVISTAIGHEQTHPDQICKETLKRVENISSCPESGQILNTIVMRKLIGSNVCL